MGLEDCIDIPAVKKMSKKIKDRIARPANSGFFDKEDADERLMRLVFSNWGSLEKGILLRLYWLVDSADGMIVDAKFQVFGPPSLIALLDAACDLLAGKNLIQARRLSAELLDKHLRDKHDEKALPEEFLHHVNIVMEAIELTVDECKDIPLAQNYISPVPHEESAGKESGGYPGWLLMSKENKMAVIDAVFNEDIRPYIEMDNGGIEIMDLIGDKELIVAYQGACTSCFSSIGATLSTIQQIVQDKIHPEIIVVPNLDDLKF